MHLKNGVHIPTLNRRRCFHYIKLAIFIALTGINNCRQRYTFWKFENMYPENSSLKVQMGDLFFHYFKCVFFLLHVYSHLEWYTRFHTIWNELLEKQQYLALTSPPPLLLKQCRKTHHRSYMSHFFMARRESCDTKLKYWFWK